MAKKSRPLLIFVLRALGAILFWGSFFKFPSFLYLGFSQIIVNYKLISTALQY